MTNDFTIRFHTEGAEVITSSMTTIQKSMDATAAAAARTVSHANAAASNFEKAGDSVSKTEGFFARMRDTVRQIVTEGKQMADNWEGARDQAMIVKQKTDEAGKSAENTAMSVKRIATSFGLVIGAVQAIRLAVNATLEQERAEISLAAALKNTGLESERVSESLKSYAKELQKTTEYSDQAILKGTAMMQNIAHLSEHEIPRAMKAAIGIAAVAERDVSQAFRLMGMAAEGNTTMLRRWGIVVDQNLSKEEQFNQVLEEGVKRFYIAEEQAKSASGRLKQLGNILADLGENMAGVIIPLVKAVTAVLSPLLNLINKLPSWLWVAVAAITAFVMMLYKLGASSFTASAALANIALGFTKVTAGAITAGGAVKTFLISIGPVGWTLLAVGAAVSAYYMLVKKSADATSNLADATNEVSSKAQVSLMTFDRLTKRLLDLRDKVGKTATEQKEYKNVIKSLNEQYGGFLKNLDDEKTKREQLIGAITSQRNALMGEIYDSVKAATLKPYIAGITQYSQAIINLKTQLSNMGVSTERQALGDIMEMLTDPIGYAKKHESDKAHDTSIFAGPRHEEIARIFKQIEEYEGKIKQLQDSASNAAEAVAKALRFEPADFGGGGGAETLSTTIDPLLSKFQSLRDELERLYNIKPKGEGFVATLRNETQLLEVEYEKRLALIKKYGGENSAALKAALLQWHKEETAKIFDNKRSVEKRELDAVLRYYDIMYEKYDDYYAKLLRGYEIEVEAMELSYERKQRLIEFYTNQVQAEQLKYYRGDALIEEFKRYAMTAEELETDNYTKQLNRLKEQFEKQKEIMTRGYAVMLAQQFAFRKLGNMVFTVEDFDKQMDLLEKTYSDAIIALGKTHDDALAKLMGNIKPDETDPFAEFMERNQMWGDMIEGLVYNIGNAFGQMLMEGKSFTESMKDAFKSFVNSAIADIMRLLARMAAMKVMQLIFSGSPVAAATGSLGGDLGGVPLPSGAYASIGGGRGSHPTPITTPTGDGNIRSLIREIRGLRRDVYAAQPQSLKVNWSRGDLSRAVDIDGSHRLTMAAR